MKTVAILIVPQDDNDGVDLSYLHDRITDDLCYSFGGFTAVPAVGGWENKGKKQIEYVVIYYIAAEDTPAHNAQLRSYAMQYREAAHQEAIYWQDFSGEIHIE